MSANPSQDLSRFLGPARFGTVMADPPWRFTNRTGKVAPERSGTPADLCSIHNDALMLEYLIGED